MRPTCRVFVATSLDGFIARPDGRIDWLEAQNARVPPGEDCGYAAFVAGIDAVVMGRRTFEQALGFERWPYAQPVVVLSRRGVAVPGELAGRVSVAARRRPRSSSASAPPAGAAASGASASCAAASTAAPTVSTGSASCRPTA